MSNNDKPSLASRIDSFVTEQVEAGEDPLAVATAMREYARQFELIHAHQMGLNDESLYLEEEDE